MRIKRSKRALPLTDLTPLIDVVFLLLIFFMLTTSFKHSSQLDIHLPQVSKQATTVKPEQIVFTIDAKGHYFINDQQLADHHEAAVASALKKVFAKNPKAQLVIMGDSRAPHGAVMTILSAAGTIGLEHINIATKATPTHANGNTHPNV